jgi:hypothetical protein
VIAAIRGNYRRIPTVRCETVATALDARVAERKVMSTKIESGGTFQITMEPRVVTKTNLVLSGRSLRAETRRPGTDDTWTHTLHNGIWTSFNAKSKQATRWYQRDIAGIVNCDPRNIGASEQKVDFLEEFAADRVTRIETVTAGGEERLVLHLERKLDDSGKVLKYRAEFDPERNYLARRVVQYEPEHGGITFSLEIELQKIEGQSAWFLKRSVQRYFAKKPAQPSDETGWTQQITTEVVGAVRTDGEFGDRAFEIELDDPRIRLRDHTRGRNPPEA